ncbi:hypothetical protein [Clostridium sp. HBUAS56010]|uniref:hypothetical protein n=1 Tax=Clostridium sp. HBUAS56010 TaxID=2571127 RepID=UPI00163D8D1C|nr:hypothetical protein [Clostridium sp. HBUAS56010]
MKEFFNQQWNHGEKLLVVAAFFMSGIILGFIFSPIKKGIYCGNHNGNTELGKE